MVSSISFVFLLVFINTFANAWSNRNNSINENPKFVWPTLGKLNHWVKAPPFSHTIHTGGRPTIRQLHSLVYAGYQSIISTSTFTTDDTTYNGVSGTDDNTWPSSSNEGELGNKYGLSVQSFNANFVVEDALKVSDLITSAPKPLFVHCHTGYSATFFVLFHQVRMGIIAPAELFSNGLLLGFDYQSNNSTLTVVNTFTNNSFELTPLSDENKYLKNGEGSYKEYFFTHRLNQIFYTAGQIQSTHLNELVNTGYNSIISLRMDNESTTRLPFDPLTGGPLANNEFGDDQGNWRNSIESSLIESKGIKYFNVGVGGTNEWDPLTFFEVLHIFNQIQNNTLLYPALVHCASGYRATAYLVTYLAYSSNQCTAWALKLAEQVGFHFDVSSDDAQVVGFIKTVLRC